MFIRIILFSFFMVSGIFGIAMLEDLVTFIRGWSFGIVEIGENEGKLFSSLFQILYIELILLGVYSLIYKKEKSKQDDSERINSYIDSLATEVRKYWASLTNSSRKNRGASVLASTFIVSVSLTVAIQITVSVSDIKSELTVKADNQLKEEIITVLKEIRLSGSESYPVQQDELNEILTISSENQKQLVKLIEISTQHQGKVSLLEDSLGYMYLRTLDADTNAENIRELLNAYVEGNKRMATLYKDSYKKVVASLDKQADSLANLGALEKNIDNLKNLQCAEITMIPDLLHGMIPDEVLISCGVKPIKSM